MIKELNIRNEAQIKRINDLACEAPYSVWLHSGTVMLDARSLLGLYALVGKRVHVVAEEGVNPAAFDRLVNEME